jgi:hypothetical protein
VPTSRFYGCDRAQPTLSSTRFVENMMCAIQWHSLRGLAATALGSRLLKRLSRRFSRPEQTGRVSLGRLHGLARRPVGDLGRFKLTVSV